MTQTVCATQAKHEIGEGTPPSQSRLGYSFTLPCGLSCSPAPRPGVDSISLRCEYIEIRTDSGEIMKRTLSNCGFYSKPVEQRAFLAIPVPSSAPLLPSLGFCDGQVTALVG